jgi:hypothetical protein
MIMSDDDFSEFVQRLGTDVPIYRECPECGDIVITNTSSYDKPKTECDPGSCPYWLPICACQGNKILFDDDQLEQCTYPDCECGPDE